MPKIIIAGVPGLDGEYEFATTFTHRDFRTIKQVSGIRANEVMDSLNAGDMDLVVALAEIALQRANVPHTVDDLWDAEAGSITMEFADDEVEVSPPPTAPPSDDSESSSGESKHSGGSGLIATDLSLVMSPPSDSGTPEPDSSESDQATLAT